MILPKSPLARQHTLLHSCDNLTNWTVARGTMSLDNVRFVEGTGSIRFTSNVAFWSGQLELTAPVGSPFDFSVESILRMKLRNENNMYPIRVKIACEVGWYEYNYANIQGLVSGVFVEARVDLAVGATPTQPTFPTTPDLTQVRQIVIILGNWNTATTFNVDWIEKIFPTSIPDFLRLLPWWQ